MLSGINMLWAWLRLISQSVVRMILTKAQNMLIHGNFDGISIILTLGGTENKIS